MINLLNTRSIPESIKVSIPLSQNIPVNMVGQRQVHDCSINVPLFKHFAAGQSKRKHVL